jgi:PBP1b-binding outer membrane lipoprotein LpoB
MIQKTFYTIAILLFGAMFLAGCQKNNGLKKIIRANDTTTQPQKTDTVVSTITYGSYNYIAADSSGNVYALYSNYGPDTIYKFDKNGNKSLFYTMPVTMQDDTVVNNTLRSLTIDSLGNIYTANIIIHNGGSNASLIKITPAGSASTIYSNFTTSTNGPPTYQLSIDGNGIIYFSNLLGINKILSNGTTSLLVSSGNLFGGLANFAVDRKGDIFYALTNSTGQTSINELLNGGLVVTIAGTGSSQTSITFGSVSSLTTDRAGNLYVAFSYNNYTDEAIAKLKYVPYNSANPVWPASLLMQGPNGHVDGPIATAKIEGPASIVTDWAGNLYFSEVYNTLLDIRKITF